MQNDPLGFAAGDQDLYRYCNGEYSTGYDPEGLSPRDEFPTMQEGARAARDEMQRRGLKGPLFPTVENGPEIIIILVALEAAVLTGGLAFEAAGPVLGAWGVSEGLIPWIAGGVAGAAGSEVQQRIQIAGGVQQEHSTTDTLISAGIGSITAGFGSVAGRILFPEAPALPGPPRMIAAPEPAATPKPTPVETTTISPTTSTAGASISACGPSNAVEATQLARALPGRGLQPNVRTLPPQDVRPFYDSLAAGGRDVTPPGFNGRMAELPDGTRIIYRSASAHDGKPTIDIHPPRGTQGPGKTGIHSQ